MTVPPVQERAPTCDFDGCNEPAKVEVQTILGRKPFCFSHGNYVAGIEAEWIRGEDELHGRLA